MTPSDREFIVEEVQETRESIAYTGLLYGLEDKPPIAESLFVALQHVLAAFVGIITPPLIICSALGVDPANTGYIISMSLFISGVCTFIQCKKIGPVGSGLLSLQGTSFAFLGPIIGVGTAAIQGGSSPQQALALIFGVCFFGSFVEIILSRFLHLAQRIITPVVSGTVVMIIGLSLIRTGMFSLAGGAIAQQNGTFGSYQNLGLGGFVLISIVLLNISGNRYLRMGSIAIGLLMGYIISIALGLVNFSALSSLPLVRIPIPFRYGMSFDFAAFIPFILLYLITAIETIGDLTATSAVSQQPIKGKLYMRRIKGGVLGDGINSLLAAVFNTFPNTTFSQNNGVIQMTGVGSRYVGFFVAGIFALLGLLPLVGGVFQALPQPVLGGATIVMFGSIAVAGINIVASVPLDRRALIIVAVSLALGLGVVYLPEILADKPALIKNVFSSGISTGGLTAILLNWLLPQTMDAPQPLESQPEVQN
ncbi:purine permease [Desertifilum sp. FACHB-1129]|uniref:Xanthine permease XanP n=1 Tax=Desertifilum tharense IPPAS B-1220 TaxID=1781255 RepID=A0A1E5QG74_9CYAN|nr:MULTISPECIES: nucleobase:cation symporter-2 family protein [Desertifilum]MDA0213645.1 nucleobase:cation symporter-2 family protein [Cyanobacteria bacterium FC1]MBD2314126.1 purine permease [Desertifilum sp. FACHB-1129]MBD2323612.1 purine permease [Desertifilum sp. FACHB-866]MBD2335064.1 purine permease [Desertifilum sp. FACHB-868]OEJ73591.1 xanthine permease XanP [Desertifilum tharense IPPAS B-1220]